MHIVLLFAIGGLLGLASNALRARRAPCRPQIDVALGTMGALFGGLLLARFLADENVPAGDYGIGAVAMAAVCAAVPLTLLNLAWKKA